MIFGYFSSKFISQNYNVLNSSINRILKSLKILTILIVFFFNCVLLHIVMNKNVFFISNAKRY